MATPRISQAPGPVSDVASDCPTSRPSAKVRSPMPDCEHDRHVKWLRHIGARMAAPRFDPRQPDHAEKQSGQQQRAADDRRREVFAHRRQLHRAERLIAHIDQHEQHQPGRSHRQQPARPGPRRQTTHQGQPRARADGGQQTQPERGHHHGSNAMAGVTAVKPSRHGDVRRTVSIGPTSRNDRRRVSPTFSWIRIAGFR